MKSEPENDFPVSESEAMQAVICAVRQLAPSELPIFLAGEPGTGKEVIADLIHTLSTRSQGPLIKINCEALPPRLIAPELFGVVTGHDSSPVRQEGLFRLAEQGTLFLAGLTAMPRDTQSRLLRVIQERSYRALGGGSTQPTDFRIIAATNQSVEAAMNQGTLRKDLYYRIGMVTISVPPLRERREDIMPLANAFLKLYSAQLGKVITGSPPPLLTSYSGLLGRVTCANCRGRFMRLFQGVPTPPWTSMTFPQLICRKSDLTVTDLMLCQPEE
jgi:transcriptional regulator with PAS, ATPase and Fis domain